MSDIQETRGQHNVVKFPEVALGRLEVLGSAVPAFDQSYNRMVAAAQPVISRVVEAVERFQQPVATETPVDSAIPADPIDPERPLDILEIRETIRNLQDAA